MNRMVPASISLTSTPRETHGRARSYALVAIWVVAAALPLVGLLSLLLRSELDPHIENYQLHFVVFGLVDSGWLPPISLRVAYWSWIATSSAP